MTTTTSNPIPALKATCRPFSIRHQGLVHRRPSAALLYSPHQRGALQLRRLLSLLSVLDPQVRHCTGPTHTVYTKYMEDTLCSVLYSEVN